MSTDELLSRVAEIEAVVKRYKKDVSPALSTDELLSKVTQMEAVFKRYKKDVTLCACYHVRFRGRSDMSGRSTIASHVIS